MRERSPSRIDNGLVANQNGGFEIDNGRVYILMLFGVFSKWRFVLP